MRRGGCRRGAGRRPGVTRVPSAITRVRRRRDSRRPLRAAFEVESEPEVDVRRELAHAVVTRGWGLLELRPVRMSLEDVFLQVTTERSVEPAHGGSARRLPVRNILAIADKELRSYFASPIAYIIIGLFSLLFGLFFYLSTRDDVRAAEPADDAVGRRRDSEHQPEMIRGLFQNAAVIILFMMPMITMRTYSEEKRSGTIELLLTSPVTDLEIILGQILRRAWGCTSAMLLGHDGLHWHPVHLRQPGVAADCGRIPRAAADGRMRSSPWACFISSVTKNQIVAGFLTLRHLPVAVGDRLVRRQRRPHAHTEHRKRFVDHGALRRFRQGHHRHAITSSTT